MKHTRYQLFQFANNTKGLNTRQALANQDKDSSSDLENVDFNNVGGIRERRGYTRITTSPLTESNFVGLHDFRPSNSSTRTLVSVVDDQIYKMDTLDGTWDNITGSVSLTTSATNYVSTAVGLDTLIGTNGVDTPWKYDQSGNASALSISNFTLSKFVKFFYQRLLHFGTTESGIYKNNRVRWSDSNTIETYTAANFLDLNTQDGSDIVGVAGLYDDIYVFKNSFSNGILRLYNTGNEIVTFSYNILNEMGAASNGSIVPISIPGVGSGLLYWGLDNKIRFFNGNISIPISDSIQSVLDALNTTKNQFIQAVNFYELNQVWFFVADGSSTTHNKVIIYDYANKAFLIHTGINANIGQVVFNSNNKPILVTGGYDGLLQQQNIGNNDDGSAIASRYWSAWLDFNDPSVAKAVRWAMVYLADLGNYSVTIQWGFNFSDAAYSSKDINLASGDDVFPFTFPITLGGTTVKRRHVEMHHSGDVNYFRIGFKNDNINEPWTVYRFDLFAKALGIKE